VYFGKWLMKKRTKQTNFNGKVISWKLGTESTDQS
jgi:hypothetical protein